MGNLRDGSFERRRMAKGNLLWSVVAAVILAVLCAAGVWTHELFRPVIVIAFVVLLCVAGGAAYILLRAGSMVGDELRKGSDPQ